MASINAAQGTPQNIDASLLEVIDKASLRLNHLVMLTLVVLLTWSAMAPLDIVSMSEGTVTPSSKVQHVQHLEGGIVRNILVKEGDTVKRNQPLINLESTANSADFGEVAARVRALTAEMARLDAEAEKRDHLKLTPEFAAENASLVERTQALFNTRRDAIKRQLAAQRDEIAQRKQDIEEISARQRNSESRLKLVEEQLAIDEKLRVQDLSSRYDQIERLKEANLLRSRIEEDKAGLARAKAALEKANNSLSAIQPVIKGEINFEQGARLAIEPLRDFMIRQTREKDLERIIEMSGQPQPESYADISNVSLVSAFMLSELQSAFQIGFVIFLPFLLIDLVAASVLMAMGMIMVPPMTISLPVKILMFVLIEGWSLVVQALVGSFH